MDLGAVPDYLHPGGVVLYERSVGVEGVAERAATGTEARPSVDYGAALSCHLRLVYRLLGGLRHAVEDPVSGCADSALCVLRAVYRRPGALDRRGDLRPPRRDSRDAGELRGYGYLLRPAVPDAADPRRGRQLYCLLRGIYGAVPDRRSGQRVYLPDDLGYLPQNDHGSR